LRIAAAAARRLCFQCAPLCLFVLNACMADPNGGQLKRDADVWVGEVEGTDVAVGIVASAERSTLFFCGGDSSYSDHTHWFLHQDPLVQGASLEDGGFRVTLSAVDQQITGTLSIAGLDPTAFSATRVLPGALAGVYDARPPCGHAGLIVRSPQQGAPPFTQGTCLTSELGTTAVEQVNPVMPVMRGADSGIAASASDAPSEMFTLHPLVLAEN
jgi:hypothetical protein